MKGISDRVKRILYIIIGTLFLIIGAIGIVVPVLPTTPFLLITAACYLRGSKKLYNWMVNNRVFGEFIENYRKGKGITKKNKLLTIAFLWVTISFSAVFVVKIFVIRVILFIVATAVSAHIMRLPTFR